MSGEALALDASGLFELRTSAGNAETSWLSGGLGKSRLDRQHAALGQGMLVLDQSLGDTLSASATVMLVAEQRARLDISEASLLWRPLPSSAWRYTIKAGAFFPPGSLENDGPGWTTSRTLSASAINSWVGEELRIKGVEVDVLRAGRFAGSPHDFGFTLGAFTGNDPAGTLIAWRGWGVGDRIVGLTETIPLAPLPIYSPGGRLYGRQAPQLDNYHEIDGRPGYYLAARYGYAGMFDAQALHYDNRADPHKVGHGQYAWDTHYSAASGRWLPGGNTEILAQAMQGTTSMGTRVVHVDFAAWYVMASYRQGADQLALRYEQFRTRQGDIVPGDNNDEDGHAVTLAWTHPLGQQLQLVLQGQTISSQRPARSKLGIAAAQLEHSLHFALRWQL
ncbi:hypothetical protein [Chitinimonas sp.]|uniref:hypothetical protein n=1 Tax=Chitinimonas sp. TaxID=1934313 RepID=UPI0035B13E93